MTLRPLTMVLLATCIAGYATCARAAEITVATPVGQVLFNPYPERTMEGRNIAATKKSLAMGLHIRIEGDITEGDVDRLAPLLKDTDRFNDAVVSLNSNGGNLAAALEVADLIHEKRVATYVGPGDSCLSACAWIFLAGQNEWIRNVLFVPARFVHAKGRVGLHAPFNQELPQGPIDQQTAEYVAEVYYSIARDAIRSIAARISPWQISPRLVVELLGKGPTEFYEIERFWRLTQNQIGLVVDNITYPSAISPLQAEAGCEFVLNVNLGPSYEYGQALAPGIEAPKPFQGVSWTKVRSTDFESTTRRDAVGRPSFEFNGLVLGRGPFLCRVTKNQNNRWEVLTEGDYPRVTDRMGDDPRIDQQPYELNSYAALGPDLPWTAVSMPDLLLPDKDADKDGFSDDLAALIPDAHRSIKGPGFDCGGDLDPAAKVICRFPTLARLDGVMGAMYKSRVKEDQKWKRNQHAWLSIRDDACPAKEIEDPAVMLMEGYCLLYFTVARINELAQPLP